MDIIISGPQGSGKTTKAQQLIAEHFGVKTIYRTPMRDLLILTGSDRVALSDVRILTATIVAARVSVVLFDEIHFDPETLALAVAAVKEARVQSGRRDLRAYYVVTGPTPLKVGPLTEEQAQQFSEAFKTFQRLKKL